MPFLTPRVVIRACLGGNEEICETEGTSLSRRAASSLRIEITSATTNDSFAANLCSNLSSSISSLTVTALTPPGILLSMPSCIYTSSSSLTYFNVSYLIVQGSAAYPDALQRLGAAMSLCQTFIFQSGKILNASSNFVNVEWSKLFSATSSVSIYGFTNTSLGPSAALPGTMPSRVLQLYFVAQNCDLTGTIPQYLMTGASSLSSFLLNVASNKLTGSVPAMFSSWSTSSPSSRVLLSVDLSYNLLQYDFPTTFFPVGLKISQAFNIKLDGNQLTGPHSNIWSPLDLTGAVSIIMSIEGNQLSGSVPVLTTTSAQYLFLNFADNQLTGTLPISYMSSFGFTNPVVVIELDLSGNQLTGNVPSNFLKLSSSSTTITNYDWMVDLSDNELEGTIASDFFSTITWASLSSAEFYFGDNPLTGNVPSPLISSGNTNQLESLIISFEGNQQMQGSVPSSFFSSLVSASTATFSASPLQVQVSFADTRLLGGLSFSGLNTRPQPLILQLDASQANFSSMTLDSTLAGSLLALDVSNNPSLVGSLPAALFANSSILKSLNASNTLLSGPMPDMGSVTTGALEILDLSYTSLDFCAPSPRAAWFSTKLSECSLLSTNAYGCQSIYPSKCTFSAPPVAPVPVTPITPPVAPPVTPPVLPPTTPPVAPPVTTTVPPAPPVAPPTGCLVSSRPSLDWECVGSSWTFVGTVIAPTLTIPTGAVQTVVVGNVTSAEIVILGVGSTLVIYEGCATNLTSITIELSKSDVDKIGTTKVQTLISVNASCQTDLSKVELNLKVSQSSCKKATAKKVVASETFSALFTVDKSGCRTWWIILASVLGAVVLIVAVLVLLVLFVRPVREFFRPHSKRKRRQAASMTGQ